MLLQHAFVLIKIWKITLGYSGHKFFLFFGYNHDRDRWCQLITGANMRHWSVCSLSGWPVSHWWHIKLYHSFSGANNWQVDADKLCGLVCISLRVFMMVPFSINKYIKHHFLYLICYHGKLYCMISLAQRCWSVCLALQADLDFWWPYIIDTISLL